MFMVNLNKVWCLVILTLLYLHTILFISLIILKGVGLDERKILSLVLFLFVGYLFINLNHLNGLTRAFI
jgi:hypothetical protein